LQGGKPTAVELDTSPAQSAEKDPDGHSASSSRKPFPGPSLLFWSILRYAYRTKRRCKFRVATFFGGTPYYMFETAKGLPLWIWEKTNALQSRFFTMA
jgi:hypothetical protein